MKARKSTLARIVLTFSLTILTLTLAAGGDRQTVRIAYLPLTHAYPLFAEADLFAGSFKTANLELVRFSSWPDLAEALNSGKVDGASILFPLALKAKQNGIGIKVVALGHRDGNVFVVKPSITSAAELRGKTVAIPSKFSSHYILLALALKKARLAFSDINLVELPPPEMPAALVEGRIDGYLVAEPFGAKAVALGKGKVLFESGELWQDSLCCALALRSDFIAGNPGAAAEVVAGYSKAAKALEKEESGAIDAGRKALKLDNGVLDLSLRWISFNRLSVGATEYARFADYVREFGLLKDPPAAEDILDKTLYPKE